MAHIVAVEYMVPVLCWIDVEEGTITQVTEHGDLIQQTGRVFNEDAEDITKTTGKNILEVLTQIADSQDWPTWEDGL
jgi:hypothetical protein